MQSLMFPGYFVQKLLKKSLWGVGSTPPPLVKKGLKMMTLSNSIYFEVDSNLNMIVEISFISYTYIPHFSFILYFVDKLLAILCFLESNYIFESPDHVVQSYITCSYLKSLKLYSFQRCAQFCRIKGCGGAGCPPPPPPIISSEREFIGQSESSKILGKYFDFAIL